MNTAEITAALTHLPVGGLRYYEQIDSTNAEAARWAGSGCPDLALLVAEKQTAGRGRAGRRWLTPPGTALAFSLVLLPDPQSHELARLNLPEVLPRTTALGALAVCEALRSGYQLPAQIKWPNDVLYLGRKLCGVLVEAHWQGSQLAAIILGIGINVRPDSVPSDMGLTFPATCVETALSEHKQASMPVSRVELLRTVLEKLFEWQKKIAGPEFIQAWESRLAFRNQWVRIHSPGGQPGEKSAEEFEGQVMGLASDGQLKLRDRAGRILTLHSGELHLRPIENPLEYGQESAHTNNKDTLW